MKTSEEKEKMLRGDLYDCTDLVLVSERTHARNLVQQYNKLSSMRDEQAKILLKELFGHYGENVLIEPPFSVDYGSNISIGDGTFVNFGCVILDCAKVEIGSNVLFGPNVQIYCATHPIDPQPRLEGKEYALPIKIGNNVWIGGGAILLPGITIGDHSTIGAGSIVNRDIPACVVAVGNPCRVVKKVPPPKGYTLTCNV